MQDIFKFDDFLKGMNKNESLSQENNHFDSSGEPEDTDVTKNYEFNTRHFWRDDRDEVNIDNETESKEQEFKFKREYPHAPSKEDMDELFASHDEDDFIKDEQDDGQVEDSENYYKLYADKSEDFTCDISIEGADPQDTTARVVVESKDWTLMFIGEIENGKCVVPIKKLNILKEGQIGNIRLEVIAEGNLFIPWEDKFKVKLSKKVTVKVNEQKQYDKNYLIKGVSLKTKH